MSNESDGRLVINTELDNEDFEKGADKLMSSIESLTARIEHFGTEMKQAFAGFAAVLQSAVTVSQNAASNTTATTREATQAAEAAQQTAQVQNRAADQTVQAQRRVSAATSGAAKAVTAYDKELSRLQKQIDKAESGLTEYYDVLKSVKEISGSAIARAGSDAEHAAYAENEATMVGQLNKKYSTQLAALNELKSQYTQVAEARAAAAKQAAAEAAQPRADRLAKASAAELKQELGSLREQIAAVKAELDGYAEKVAEIKRTTDKALKGITDGPGAESQVNSLLAQEAQQLETLRQQYVGNLQTLGQLEAEHSRVASAIVAQSDLAKPGLFTQALTAMVEKLREAYAPAAMAARATETFKNTLHSMASTAAKAAQCVAKITCKAVAAGAKKAVSGLKAFTTQAKKSVFGSNNLVKSLTSLKTILVSRIKRMFISALFKDVANGLKQLALFDSSFNDTMTGIQNSITQLRGNIAALVGNLISALKPVVTAIVELFNGAVTSMNRFFAVLSGKNAYAAARKSTEKYAEAAEDAVDAQKNLNAELYSFDELNRQSDPTTAGTSSDETTIQFDELPVSLPAEVQQWVDDLKSAWSRADWGGMGAALASGLNMAARAVDYWFNNVLHPKGTAWAHRAGEILNGLFDGADWPTLGKTVADGLNAVADTVNTFFTTFRARNFGSGIGAAIKSWFDNVDWPLVGQTFANGWTAMLHIIEGTVTTPGIWTSIGQSVAAFIRSWFSTIDVNSIATSLISLLNGVTEMVKAFLDQNPFAGVAQKVAGALNRVLHEVNWGEFGRTLGNLFLNALRTLLTFVQQMDWQQLGRSVGEFLAGIDWAGILATVGQLIWEAVKAAIESLVGLLKGLGPEMIIAAIAAVVAVIAGRIAAATLLAPIISALGTALTTIVTGICTAIAGWPALVIAAAAAAIAALVIWIKNGGAEVIAGWFEGMEQGLANIGAWLKEHLVDPFINFFKRLFGIHSPSTVMAEQGGHVIAGLLQGLTQGWSSITEFLSGAVSGLLQFLSGKWQEMAANAREHWSNLKTNVTTAFENARTGLQGTATQIGSALRSKWSEICTNAQTAWSNVKTTLSNAMSGSRSSAQSSASGMRSDLNSTFSGIVSNAQTAWSNLQTATLNRFSNLRTNVLNAWVNLRSNLNEVKWDNVGNNLVAGLNNGIVGAWGGLMGNVSGLVNSLIQRVNRLFDINSPSGVFQRIGEFLDLGLEKGMIGGERGLLNTAKNIATAVTAGMTPDTPSVQMNVDSVVGSMQAIISSLGSLAVTFQTIANALTSIGGFTLPNIAAGRVVPYQTRIAANAAPAGGEGGVEAYLLGILAELQALSRSVQNGDSKQTGDIRVIIGGREVFQVVVDENNRAVRATGKSPLKV